MKNTGYILLLLLCLSLAACKTSKSHVQQSSIDSAVVNREKSNIGILAVSARVTNDSLSLDSTWNNAIRLTNFSGIIFKDGKVKGSADLAEVSQSGTKRKTEGTAAIQRDSTDFRQSVSIEAQAQFKQKETQKQTARKGVGVHLWVWLPGLLVLAGLFRVLLKKFKSNLKIF